MSKVAQHGYLVLADISGYTSFVADTELEHSHEILSDLLETICTRIELLLTIHKLEGDAVFAYVPESKISRGETILELVESTYAAFRDRQNSIKRATTCTCNACRNIPSLDLKFIVHHGDYIIQSVREIKEMVGSDVNLAHRLLKNHVADITGWRAYALFTEQSLKHMGMQLENAHKQVESYEHLGDVTTHSLNMHERYAETMSARHAIVSEDEADFIMKVDFPTSLPLTWEWLHDPKRRNLVDPKLVWTKGERPRNRTGSGASNHCAHGKSVNTEIVLDWHPFEYATLESHAAGKKVMKETMSLTPLPNGGTRVQNNIVIAMPLPHWLRRLAAKVMLGYVHDYPAFLRQAARLAGEELSKVETE